jgi:hypothetical protein
MAFKSVNEFLNHKGNERGGAKRLKNWSTDPGYLNFWFHVAILPTAAWFHRIPELVIRDDKDNPQKKLRNIWGRSHACWEDESILKKARFRTAAGTREHPPKKCGLCRLTEAVREAILDGTIKDTDVLFEFKGSDKPEEDCVLHAGSLCNFWKRDISDEEKARLNAGGISLKTSWKENAVAKLSYIFVGVNADDLGEGLQVAVQTQALGDAVKRCINDEIARKDGDKGNPFMNPYCVRFIYRASEPKFDDKYHAIATEKPLSPEIERLIRGEPPSIEGYTRKFNQDTMRSLLKTRATPLGKKLPWDRIFDVPQKIPADAPADKPKAQAQVPADVAPPKPAAPPPSGPNDQPREGDALGDPCEPPCGAPMKAGATVCWKCKAEYKDDGQAPAASAAQPPSTGAPPDAALYDDNDVPF